MKGRRAVGREANGHGAWPFFLNYLSYNTPP